MASKISTITAILNGAHVMGEDGLKAYHDARSVRNAMLRVGRQRQLGAVIQAIKNYRVTASYNDTGIRLYRAATQQELVLPWL